MPVIHGDGFTAIVCTGRKPKACRFCGRPSTKLCDAPLSASAASAATCDAPMCDRCAKPIGTNRDLCPTHASAA